jgi:hypothetical protein
VVSHKNCHIGKWNRVKRIDTTPPSWSIATYFQQSSKNVH